MQGEPKNIIHVTNSLDIGGLEVLLLEFFKRIDRKQYHPIVCTFTKNGFLFKEFQDIGVSVYVVEKRNGIDYVLPFKLSKLFKKNKICLVHTHNVGPWLYSTVAAKLSNTPYIVHTEHSNVSSNKKRLFIAERYLAKYTNAIIADSKAVANYLTERQGISSKKVVTILNGIDVEEYQKKIDIHKKRKEIGLEQDDLVVGIVARLIPVKNHICLLKAFSLIKNKIKNVKLVIVGDGEWRNKLEEYVKTNSLDRNVIFLGNRRDIAEIMKTFNLFVLPSFSEGLSITLLEAMACAIPIIATDVGGNREVLGDNEAGILIPSDSVDALTEVMTHLLTNKDKRDMIGRAGLQRVNQYFSLTNMVRKYEQVYERIFHGVNTN